MCSWVINKSYKMKYLDLQNNLDLEFVAQCHCQLVDLASASMVHTSPDQALLNHPADSLSRLPAMSAISDWILQSSICMVQQTTLKQIWVKILKISRFLFCDFRGKMYH